ncbi:hypothetical protein [Dyella flagellata]|uniref:Uncharacterized protein n=1 Tax=Dyella flagellata TaxID=1867833 RepID=A0ABQ5XB69_9GAMM|nr:hypothetical protein [Dyella flagellata]GLQ88865.1 hypothetical protein GCM10007898_24360 [Dyella flagellata]
MKKLNSNGIKTADQEWYGVDKLGILYPAVSSCVTVTCVVKGGLAGLHLASLAFPAVTDADIAEYGKVAQGATAMYLVGMLSLRWEDDSKESKRNFTGLKYGAADGGTLIARLREKTGFTGVVWVKDTSSLAGELEITATLAEGAVIFKVAATNLAEQRLADFTSIGGDVILPPPNNSSRCVIL